VNIDNVSRDDWIIGGVTLLLIIDLLFLAWFSVSVSAGPVSATFTSTATGDPDGWLGILAVLALILVIVDLAVERFSPQTTMPSVQGSRTMTRLVLVGAAAVFLLLKFLFQISHFSDLGIGFWAALVLTALLVYFSLQARNAGPASVTSTPSTTGTPTV
jgi:hypothetical protein